jgi:plasmid replication initiation protein
MFMPKPKTIKKNYLVEKQNFLNEVQTSCMSLQEMRFFCIYLCKINARNPETRVVRFSIPDFQKIMDLVDPNMENLKHTARNLLKHLVIIPREDGRYKIERTIVLFTTCEIGIDPKTRDGYVEINAHDDAMPLLFEYKSRYFAYEIWNALRLKSTNQIRMYEILKQHEFNQTHNNIPFTIGLDELKELLGLEKDVYPRYNNFRTWVLESCRQALAQYTDIKFSYKPSGKLGSGGKVYALEFTIEKNLEYEEPLSFDEFIVQSECDPGYTDPGTAEEAPEDIRNEHEVAIDMLWDACDQEFSKPQIETYFSLIFAYFNGTFNGLGPVRYLSSIYKEVKVKNGIATRYGYIKNILKKNLLANYSEKYLKEQYGIYF